MATEETLKESVLVRALEVASEGRSLAEQAHKRIDTNENAIISLQKALLELTVSVSRLNTKVAIAAGFGSLVGGGIIAGVITWIASFHHA